MKRFLASVALTTLGLITQATLPFYQLVDVGPWKPSMVIDWSTPRVNETGHVMFSLASSPEWCGLYDPNYGHSYVIDAGGSYLIRGSGINDQWAVTGTAIVGGSNRCYMAGNGWSFDMGLPPAVEAARGVDINNNFDTLVQASTPTLGTVQVFKYTLSGGYQLIPNFPSPGLRTKMRGWAINAAGDVCGSSYVSNFSNDTTAWFFNGTTTTAMPFASPADTYSKSNDLNDYRVVVGSSGNRACYWLPDWGFVTYLPGIGTSNAAAISNSGIIVGSLNSDAVAWESATAPVPLASRVTAGGSGWTLVVATDVAETGYITGVGYKNGQARVFLLKPL